MVEITNFTKGIIRRNPVFVILLGLCPTLAVTTSFNNGFGMGVSTLFVLIFSAIIVSSIKYFVPKEVRIPVFIVIIATFVTMIDLILKAYFPILSKALGIYVPLITVNCIILGRAEAFSSKNTVINSLFDAIGMGVGFTLALSVIGIIREIIGTGMLSFFSAKLINLGTPMVNVFILAPGAFFTLAFLLALFRQISKFINRGSL